MTSAIVCAVLACSIQPARAWVGKQACAQAANRSGLPVAGRSPLVARPAPRPAKGQAGRDPTFDTCVVRATDHEREPPRAFARNDYSRRQAFNADNTRFIVYASGGAWHLYDAGTLAWLRELKGPQSTAELQWSATNPDILLYLPNAGGMQLLKLDVNSNRSEVVADFNGQLPWPKARRVWTRAEGSPSADGRYWCLLAETEKHAVLGFFTYDLVRKKVLATRDLAKRPDSVSMSPSGRYCVVAAGSGEGGTWAWDRQLKASRALHSDSEHSDIARGRDGHDIYVFVNHQRGGNLTMVDIDTGTRTPLLPTYIDGTTTSLHVSGKAFARPGWILVSTFNHSGREKWLHERLLAVQLKANPRIINLAHHHSFYNGYWTQPQASVSRDFRFALFNSNWGSRSAMDVDAYLIGVSDTLLQD